MGAPLKNKNALGHEGSGGKPPNWLREECRKAACRIDTVGILEKAAKEEKGALRLEAIKMLWDRGWGKAEQIIEVNQNDDNRPSTDVLIQTITAIRAELDSIRAGNSVTAGK